MVTTTHAPSRSRYVSGCRCAGCTAENRAYNEHHKRQQLYGRPTTDLVDAGPVREHVARLVEAGMGTRTIAGAAGLGRNVVTNLLHGRPSRGNPPTARLRPDTARALLSVAPALAGKALVDASGSRRRLRALVARGWTMTRLAEGLGMKVSNLAPLVSGTGEAQVTQAFAERVRALYEDLWDAEPPCDNSAQRGAVSRARKLAAERGWPPPAAWDDDLLDLTEADLSDRLEMLAAEMDDLEVGRCYRARREGDISPLVLAGSREYFRRRRAHDRRVQRTSA